MLQFDFRCLAALLLVAGCASPNSLSGLMSRKPQNETLEDVLAQRNRATSPGYPPGDPWNSESSAITQAGHWNHPRGGDVRVADLLQSGSRALQSGNSIAARAAYEQVITLDPEHVYAHSQLAILADNERRFDDAERHYRVVLRKQPNNPDVLSNIGWSYLLQRRYEESASVLREALRIAPRHQKANFNLGWLYGLNGNYDAARNLFLTAGSEAQAQRALAELFPNGPPAGREYAGAGMNGIPGQDHASLDNRAAELRSDDRFENRSADLRPGDPQYPNEATRKIAEEMQKQKALWDQQQAARQNQRNSRAGAMPALPRDAGEFNPNTNRVAPTDYTPPPDLRTGRVDDARMNSLFNEIDRQAAQSPTQANQPQTVAGNGFAPAMQTAPPFDARVAPPHVDPRALPGNNGSHTRNENTMSPRWPAAPPQLGANSPSGQIEQAQGINAPATHWGNQNRPDLSGNQTVVPAGGMQENWGSQNAGTSSAAPGAWPSQQYAAPPGSGSQLQQAQATAAALGLSAGPFGGMFPLGQPQDINSGSANYRPNTPVPEAPIRGGNVLPQYQQGTEAIEFQPLQAAPPSGPAIRPIGGGNANSRQLPPSNVMQTDGRQPLAAPEITNAGYEIPAGAPQQAVQQAGGQLPEWPRQPLSNGFIPSPVVPSAQSQVYGGQPVISPGPTVPRPGAPANRANPVDPNWQRLPPR
jgi:tetratricopeptide (TPR) repeat protein